MKIDAFNPQFGSIARTSGMAPFAEQFDSHLTEIISALKDTGFVHFQGAGIDQQEFELLTEKLTVSDAAISPALHGSKARDVFSRKPELGMHAEQYYLPWRPDLIAFHCERPADHNGRTLVCDGIRFLSELSMPTLELFREQPLSYNLRFSRKRWKWTFNVKNGRQLKKLLNAPGVRYRFSLSRALHFNYTVSAIQQTRFQQADAFVNAIVHALDYPGYGLRLANGMPISAEVEKELREIAARTSVAIPWQAGDFAIIDNSRVLHGREAYTDPNRMLRAKHGLINFEVGSPDC